MATNTWSSAASTDMNLGANWSLGHVPDATEDAVFDGTSVINATATAAFTCKTLTTAAAYSGNFSDGGQTFTVSGAISFDGTGTLTLTGIIVIAADGGFHVGSDVGVTSISSVALTVNGTGSIDLDKANAYLGNITLTPATPKTVTWSGSGSNIGISNAILTMNANATLTKATTLTNAITTQANPFNLTSGYTINGTGWLELAITPSVASLTVNIPELTLANSSALAIEKYGTKNLIVNQNGNISIGSAAFLLYARGGGGGSFTYNTNNYSISSSAWGIGSLEANTIFTFNSGSSIINVISGTVAFGNNSGTNYLNFQTSTWTIAAPSWTYLSSWTIDVGTTAQITFTANTVITTIGKNFPYVIFQGTASLSGSTTFKRLKLTANKTYTFGAGSTYTILNYTNGDWDGTGAATKVTMVSSTPGTRWNLTAPTSIAAFFVNVTDSYSTNPIYAVNSTDGGGNNNWVFAIPAPTLDTPANFSEDIALATTLQWNASAGADTYHLQVSALIDFSVLDVDETGITDVFMAISGLDSDTNYYWRVKATGGGVDSAWSDIWGFMTVLSVPNDPAGLEAAQTPGSNDIRLTWNFNPNTDSFKIYRATSPTGSYSLIDSGIVANEYLDTTAVSGTTYFYKIKATNSGGDSDYSAYAYAQSAIDLDGLPYIVDYFFDDAYANSYMDIEIDYNGLLPIEINGVVAEFVYDDKFEPEQVG